MIQKFKTAFQLYHTGGLQSVAEAALQDIAQPQRLQLRSWRRSLGKSRAHPLKIFWVDPDQIPYKQALPKNEAAWSLKGDHRRRFHKYREVGVILDGDWDRFVIHFEDHPAFTCLQARFEEGAAWEETEVFQRLARKLAKGRRVYYAHNAFCSSMAELEARFAMLDRLYDSIRTSGYRAQGELHENPSFLQRLDEVTVNIARDGTFIQNSSGKHRLAITKLLAVERIPVRVLVRHRAWQHRREELAHCKSLDDLRPSTRALLDHPDLADLRAFV